MPRYKKTIATVLAGRIGTAISGGGQMRYIPVISYRYEVDGQEYSNDRFTENTVGRGIQSSVQKIVNRYPPNSTIEIFYNVDDPADAYIHKGFGRGVNTWLRITAVVAILVLIAIAYAQSQGIISLF